MTGGEPGERVTPAEAMTGGEPGEGVTPAEGEGATRRSGLRNPQAAVRGLGAGTLILEAVVLLLAIQPIRILGGDLSGWGVAAVIGLAVVAILLAGVMSRPWAWVAGAVLQAVLIACGLLHWSLAVLGIIFAGAWAYAAYVRKTILG
ncbi:DUF4233 domain-containing protein [Actinoplanes sp. NPDC051513]|uniref:DUF4233 domain-containing protein n=1 Tax=Actinoplanes sp. NPDC051513 TaxID=3363908 RepID=UPI0037ACC66E